MSTRGNILFVDHFWLQKNEITIDDIVNNSRCLEGAIENSFKIYVHSDMYPSGALNDLQQFLQLDGAKHRATDASYLSAWFVGWKCLDMSIWTRRYADDSFDPQKCKNPSLKNFKESKDFFGVGLLHEPTDWASYSYIVVPNIPDTGEIYKYDEHSFDILIYDGYTFKNLLGIVNSEDNVDEYVNEDWWY